MLFKPYDKKELNCFQMFLIQEILTLTVSNLLVFYNFSNFVKDEHRDMILCYVRIPFLIIYRNVIICKYKHL